MDGHLIMVGHGPAVRTWRDIVTSAIEELLDLNIGAFDPAIFGECDGRGLLPYLADVAPWMFKFDPPWTAPVYYSPAPRKVMAISIHPRKKLCIYKQPKARAGFLRGQRR